MFFKEMVKPPHYISIKYIIHIYHFFPLYTVLYSLINLSLSYLDPLYDTSGLTIYKPFLTFFRKSIFLYWPNSTDKAVFGQSSSIDRSSRVIYILLFLSIRLIRTIGIIAFFVEVSFKDLIQLLGDILINLSCSLLQLTIWLSLYLSLFNFLGLCSKSNNYITSSPSTSLIYL